VESARDEFMIIAGLDLEADQCSSISIPTLRSSGSRYG
jgi:hypothetical protein